MAIEQYTPPRVIDLDNPDHFPPLERLDDPARVAGESTFAGWKVPGDRSGKAAIEVYRQGGKGNTFQISFEESHFMLHFAEFKPEEKRFLINWKKGFRVESSLLPREPLGKEFPFLLGSITLAAYHWNGFEYTVFKVARRGDLVYQYFAVASVGYSA